MLPLEIVTYVLQQPVPDGGRADEVVWMPTKSGKFTLSSTFQKVRQARNSLIAFSQIWDSRTPLKVSFFMLWLLMGRLPLDDVLCKIRFHLPSKCFCYSMAAGESNEQVFSTGQVALEVWSFFFLWHVRLSFFTFLVAKTFGWLVVVLYYIGQKAVCV
mgnify:CR=1 FL=1